MVTVGYFSQEALKSFIDVFNNADCFPVYPASFRKVGCPIQGRYISCNVPSRFLTPIEIFSEVYPDIKIGSEIQ